MECPYRIKPNLRELDMLSDHDLEGEEEQEKAAMDLVQNGKAVIVVVSLGAAGAFMATQEGIERFRAPTVRIRSKVGAGDSMVAGIVFALANGKRLREAIFFWACSRSCGCNDTWYGTVSQRGC